MTIAKKDPPPFLHLGLSFFLPKTDDSFAFNLICIIIDNGLKKGRCLVHCDAGVSRSPSVLSHINTTVLYNVLYDLPTLVSLRLTIRLAPPFFCPLRTINSQSNLYNT